MDGIIWYAEEYGELFEFTNETCYEKLKTAVGGWIECVSFPSGLTMWVNEEGKLEGLKKNAKATALWQDNFGETDVVVGNVVFTGGADKDGNTIGLTEEQCLFLLSYDKVADVDSLDVEDFLGWSVTSW
jgi:Domain of unknown function (DUF3846)